LTTSTWPGGIGSMSRGSVSNTVESAARSLAAAMQSSRTRK